jgi:hypothetical protein
MNARRSNTLVDGYARVYDRKENIGTQTGKQGNHAAEQNKPDCCWSVEILDRFNRPSTYTVKVE